MTLLCFFYGKQNKKANPSLPCVPIYSNNDISRYVNRTNILYLLRLISQYTNKPIYRDSPTVVSDISSPYLIYDLIFLFRLRQGIIGLLVGVSLQTESLCCVLQLDTLVLVQPRNTRRDLTKKLLTGA